MLHDWWQQLYVYKNASDVVYVYVENKGGACGCCGGGGSGGVEQESVAVKVINMLSEIVIS